MEERKRLPKEERMLEIRNHAKKIFLKKGFDKTTMEDVIEAAKMSKGGVYRHYSSTTEMLYDLMLDGNIYRSTLIHEYLTNNQKKDTYEQVADILIAKALASTDLMELYVIFLQAKKYNNDLEKLYQKLKIKSKNEFSAIVKDLGIKADIFKDDFLINYVNGLIVSSDVLEARHSFDIHKKYLKETIINYIINAEKKHSSEGEA